MLSGFENRPWAWREKGAVILLIWWLSCYTIHTGTVVNKGNTCN